MSNIIQHIAFIMDGNRRWARAHGKIPVLGHKQGVETLKKIVHACIKRGIPYITFWALSTENLKERSVKELRYLFHLIQKSEEHTRGFMEEACFIPFGDMGQLPKYCQEVLQRLEKKTRNNTKINVAVGFNYGGRDEIVRTAKKIIQKGIPAKSVTEHTFAQYLDTKGMPDPDLVIRTGGRKRLSGLMPWQTIYSDLYFTDVLWPDFDEKELDKAIKFFNNTQRNFGK